MQSLRFLDRRVGFSLGAIGLLLGMVLPAAFPVFASAADVTSRSVEMSSSAAAATNVTYSVTFTPVSSASYAVLFFCDDSPIPGQTCTAPTGFSVTSASLGTGSDASATITGTRAANKLEINDSTTGLSSSGAAKFVLTGVTNPTNPTDATANNGLYMRIETFSGSSDADAAYASATTTTNMVDQGGVALAVTNTIGVQAIVRETMTFCVAGSLGTVASLGAGNGPSGSCGADNADGTTGATGLDTTDLNLNLGHGTPVALDSSAVNTAADWAQISTNAVGGAQVSMTDTNTGGCNGLFRVGGTIGTCDIAGVGSSAAAITAGLAKFGMSLGTPVSAPNSVATPTGTLTTLAPYTGASGNYGMGTGVTGTYGDPIFNTNSAPIANKNVELTFAASAAPTTPAGIYQATMNLIATGTF